MNSIKVIEYNEEYVLIQKKDLKQLEETCRQVNFDLLREALPKYKKFESNSGNNKKKDCSLYLYKQVWALCDEYEKATGKKAKPRNIVGCIIKTKDDKRKKINRGFYYTALKRRKEI